MSQIPYMLSAGWKTEQTYSTSNTVEYYQIRLKPYAQAYISISSIMNIDKLYYAKLSVELDKFIVNLFADVVIWYNGYFCIQAGWATQDIQLKLTSLMKF